MAGTVEDEGVVVVSKFSQLTKSLAGKGARNPRALAAWIGRRKYGAAGMAAKSASARKRKARRR